MTACFFMSTVKVDCSTSSTEKLFLLPSNSHRVLVLLLILIHRFWMGSEWYRCGTHGCLQTNTKNQGPLLYCVCTFYKSIYMCVLFFLQGHKGHPGSPGHPGEPVSIRYCFKESTGSTQPSDMSNSTLNSSLSVFFALRLKMKWK